MASGLFSNLSNGLIAALSGQRTTLIRRHKQVKWKESGPYLQMPSVCDSDVVVILCMEHVVGLELEGLVSY